MAVNAIRVPVVKDNQIFEYSKTLSLPVDATQAHLEPGDVVVINKDNGIAGILQSKVRPTTDKAEQALTDVLVAPTYGLNGPGYALCVSLVACLSLSASLLPLRRRVRLCMRRPRRAQV